MNARFSRLEDENDPDGPRERN